MAEESDATAWTKVSNPDGREYYWNKGVHNTRNYMPNLTKQYFSDQRDHLGKASGI